MFAQATLLLHLAALRSNGVAKTALYLAGYPEAFKLKMITFLISSALAYSQVADQLAFLNFQAKYGKSYASPEHHTRSFQTFTANLRLIE